MVGVNVPIPVPLAYYTFGGWKRSGFGDLNQHGPDAFRFYTKTKTVTSRWPSGIKEGAEFVDPDDEVRAALPLEYFDKDRSASGGVQMVWRSILAISASSSRRDPGRFPVLRRPVLYKTGAVRSRSTSRPAAAVGSSFV